MPGIFEKLESKVTDWRKEAENLLKEHSEKTLSEVSLKQAYGGMRGVKTLICDTSRVPPEKGLIIRGTPLLELIDRTPEEIYYLLLTGELPGKEELDNFSSEIKKRKNIPGYVWDVLKAMPEDSHPMTMFDTAILVMQRESVFRKKYAEGLKKEDFWKATLEDALNIVAKLPAVAGGVYNLKYKKGDLKTPDPGMDLAEDYVHMLGINDSKDFVELMRMYLVCHSDHEGGNVSAFSTQTINSALSDLYYSLTGGFNGLAGPLHGLANQENVKWILSIMERFNGIPTEDQIKQLVKENLNAGRVIFGYGHAVLRVVDPRFQALLDFGKKHFPDDPVFATAKKIFEVVPGELKKVEKIKNPWPNVDAVSGSILYHYGLKEFSYYTVLFAVSRSLGLTAQAVVNRALMLPIIRPKSITTQIVKEMMK